MVITTATPTVSQHQHTPNVTVYPTPPALQSYPVATPLAQPHYVNTPTTPPQYVASPFTSYGNATVPTPAPTTVRQQQTIPGAVPVPVRTTPATISVPDEAAQIAALRKFQEEEFKRRRVLPPQVAGERGLENPVGANNCFLNVVLQALWHLNHFHRGFDNVTTHKCANSGGVTEACIVCAVQALFVQYQYSDHQHLPPKEIRHVVAKHFAADSRFQVDAMDDAAELLDALLEYFHSVTSQHGDACEPPCVVHKVFASSLLEQSDKCSCGANSEPNTYTSFLHYFPAKLLQGETPYDQALHMYIQSEHKTCECGKQITTGKYLLNQPQILPFVLIWGGENAEKEAVEKVVEKIKNVVRPSQLFRTTTPTSNQSMYQLSGVVCFYGRHYVCYFNNTRLQKWVFFDDSSVKSIGEWFDVKKHMTSGRYQPFILFYSLYR